jgi:hypothetical protein
VSLCNLSIVSYILHAPRQLSYTFVLYTFVRGVRYRAQDLPLVYHHEKGKCFKIIAPYDFKENYLI